MSQQQYNADAIEVLSGLDPVRKRPGMYTDTSRPNHLAQEVIDNSVDEALAGHARRIDVVLHSDNSLSVEDDGRGMPVDIHKEQGVPGVELILTRLHAGGKFSEGNYNFSGGLHGVGVSVVNALSTHLEVLIKRDGQLHRMTFANGDKASELEVVDTVGKRRLHDTVAVGGLDRGAATLGADEYDFRHYRFPRIWSVEPRISVELDIQFSLTGRLSGPRKPKPHQTTFSGSTSCMPGKRSKIIGSMILPMVARARCVPMQ